MFVPELSERNITSKANFVFGLMTPRFRPFRLCYLIF